MVTMRIKGGLGNQLFQYACGYSLARRLEQELELDTSFFPNQTLRGYKLGSLNVDFKATVDYNSLPFFLNFAKDKRGNKIIRVLNRRVVPAGNGWKLLIETRPKLTEEFFTVNGDKIFVDGYFQTEMYFNNYRSELLRQFTPNYVQEDEFYQALDEIKNVNAVAVHVRRGDFLKAQYESNPRHYLLGADYYIKALDYSDNIQEHPVYFWFSDDIDWVKKTFGERENFRYISLHTKHADIDEMMLMKNCNHIITANSTFSWWAAWLNENDNAMILCPEKAYGIPEMIPDRWLKIDIEEIKQ